MAKSKKAQKKQEVIKTFTVEQLLDQANVAMSSMQLELAEKFYCRALVMSPDDTNIMDALSDVYLQLGEMENALQLLIKSTSMAPKENPYKWMFLGQLQSGLDSIESYRTGINILVELLDMVEKPELSVRMKKQISKAHCSIAEIFLTDLCFEECAEINCEKEIQDALQIDPESLDGLQTLASLRLSQNRRLEACQTIDVVNSRVVQIRDVVRARTVVDELIGVAEPAEFLDNPEFEFCIATAKILIECAAEDTNFANKAMDLISDLLQDDDENVELWYLMGVGALSCSPPDVLCARENLERAKEMMDRIREDCDNCGEVFLYEEQLGLVVTHLQMLDGCGEVSDGKVVDGLKEDEDEEWSSCDSDDEMNTGNN